MSELDPWINSAGQNGNRNSMQYFEGTGDKSSYEFNFAGGYISPGDVKAYIYRTATGLTEPVDPVVLTGPNTIQIPQVVPTGDFLVVYRDTQKTVPLVNFVGGAVLNEANLDKVAEQAIFAVAEMFDRFDDTRATAVDSIERAAYAVATADAADTKATAAVTTATAADVKADAAVLVIATADANSAAAVATANAIDGKAQQALDNAAAAVATANASDAKADDALDVVTAIDGKANQALQEAGTALGIAQGVDGKADAAIATANSADGKADGAIADVSNLSAAHQTLDGQLDFTIIYPNGGSEAEPANVAINSRYVMARPFQGHELICKPQLFRNGKWVDHWFTAYAPGTAYGLTVGTYGGDLVIQTAITGLDGSSNVTGSLTAEVLLVTSAPCRIKVWKLKGQI